MLSKRLLVILIMAIMLVSTLVKDGEAAGTRKDINMDQKKATAGEEKKVSDVRGHLGFFDGGGGGDGGGEG